MGDMDRRRTEARIRALMSDADADSADTEPEGNDMFYSLK